MDFNIGTLITTLTGFKCWTCEDDSKEEAKQELKIAEKPIRNSSMPSSKLDEGTSLNFDEKQEDVVDEVHESPARSKGPPLSARELREQERDRLRKLMKDFANRGMQGVPVKILNEGSESLEDGLYRIDDRLTGITFMNDLSPNRSGGGSSHTVLVEQVVEVSYAQDVALHLATGSWESLSKSEQQRLLVLSYSIDPPGSPPPLETRKVLFLEKDEADAKMFLTCVRILRRYFKDVKMASPRSI
eukprot:TRINITY_DN50619_c0_g1_i1.p1 TRINITY_DN50619_c0_g1~~TRINITY_DN50619_c0_g1_i1.p1  ORF type:complete len:244 (-),score=49.85 TRINITY_DN50619_c0_g1_i1:125-856(-)